MESEQSCEAYSNFKVMPCTLKDSDSDKKYRGWGNLNWSSTLFENKSFTDVMSEDLAENLHIRNYIEEPNKDCETSIFETLSLEEPSDTDSDLLLAHMLQYEFDKEFDDQLQREERHINKNSKLSISFSNYKVCPEWYGSDSEEDVKNLDDENRMLDSFEERVKNELVVPSCGYICHKNTMVTKHDGKIDGRKNAQRVMNLPPGVNTGDGGGFDMELSNKVYNKLLTSTRKELNKKYRVHDKSEKAVAEQALDPKTRLVIFKMISNGILENVGGVISTGKEAAVFYAVGGIFEGEAFPCECALKIFKTHLTDFKTRERYIKEDYRFKDRVLNGSSKTTIMLWAEKEFHNLRRLQLANIRSPKPLLIRKQVLVMSFVGENHIPAPKLKNLTMNLSCWENAYSQVEEMMISMFRECRLIHADLSEYNILWFDDQCWFIDVGQAIESTHTSALKYLYRDCCNVIRFFKSKGVVSVLSAFALFKKVSGVEIGEEECNGEIAIGEYELDCQMKKEKNNGDCFDFLWNEMIKREPLSKDENNLNDNTETILSESKIEEEEEKSWMHPPAKRRGKKNKAK